MRSYRTISPLPFRGRKGGLFLLHWPSAYAAQALPGTLPGEVRTFLEHDRQAFVSRPPGPLDVSRVGALNGRE